ncbi:MAG: hypothetical protein KGN79_11590 [Acidobacteriota bacterium]|nr:hypothetical protein [Acidobacteriota bacterium]
MKKFLSLTAMVLVAATLVLSPALYAQDSVTIKDPAEFNAYQMATQQTDPHQKAAALESFVTTYPQSVVKDAVLDMLISTYQGLGEQDKALSAASRLLQDQPNNMKAIFISVFIKKQQCEKTQDAQACDDAAALAQKGLAAQKPADVAEDAWKQQTGLAFPIFQSTIALDYLVKKDYKSEIDAIRKELMLYTPEQATKGPALVDTIRLAEAYTKPGVKDLVQAVWFYARAWNFVPANFKAQIEPKLEYYYKVYHGNLKGLDDIKSQAAASVFPPGSFEIAKAPTPAELAHQAITGTPDLKTLNLSDKEFILANGSKEDADTLWAVMKDQLTPVPGTVVSADANTIKLAVSQDAKDANVADFIVNMKKPLTDKEIPAAGTVFGLLPNDNELDGTYDSYTQIPATATLSQRTEIVLRDGFIQEKKKAPVRKPAASHHKSRSRSR